MRFGEGQVHQFYIPPSRIPSMENNDRYSLYNMATFIFYLNLLIAPGELTYMPKVTQLILKKKLRIGIKSRYPDHIHLLPQ